MFYNYLRYGQSGENSRAGAGGGSLSAPEIVKGDAKVVTRKVVGNAAIFIARFRSDMRYVEITAGVILAAAGVLLFFDKLIFWV
ncbi:MAG: hypothetical protein Q8O90_10230 [Elusimicrobiota bacterium]|nr:hypothetical protein [Elusimicrobiota bacterium]